MNNKSINKCYTDEVCEVGDPWKRLTDDELEGDGCEEKEEGELETVLRQTTINRECSERQSADEHL